MEFVEILLVLLVIGLIGRLFGNRRQLPKNKNDTPSTSVPGLLPSDPVSGNVAEIQASGTIGKFLSGLHESYGPIVSFWEGTKMAVSISDPEMMKQCRQLSEIPPTLLEQFNLLLGAEIYHFGERRKAYEQFFMLRACKNYAPSFLEIAQEMTQKWKKEGTKPIPLMETMSLLSLTALVRTCFGDYFNDDKTMLEYQELVDYVIRNSEPPPREGSPNYEIYAEKCRLVNATSRKILEDRRQKKPEDIDQEIFVDVLLDLDISDEARTSDMTAFISLGYLTTASTMMWFLYEVAQRPDIQDKIYSEIISELGNESISIETVPKLVYLRQVIDETLRSYMNQIVSARIAEKDMDFSGYHVPMGTTLYFYFDSMFMDPLIWHTPEKFDPDHFAGESSHNRHPYSFKPFGFAGKRVCLGQTFALYEMAFFFSEWFRNYRFRLVSGNDARTATGFIALPDRPILVAVEPR